MSNRELYHHGVKGMKWGVRRTPSQLGYKTQPKQKRKSSIGSLLSSKKQKKSDNSKSADDSKKPIPKPKPEAKPQPKQKTARDMTDDELRRAINRIELERRYNQLNPQQVSMGKEITNRIIKNMVIPAAEDIGKQFIKSQMTKLVNEKLGLGEEYRVYTNNKKK